MIQWQNDQQEILLNPRIPENEQNFLQQLQTSAPPMKAIVWLTSSGSSAENVRGYKLIALSKKAILGAAHASNEHLQSTAQDTWLQIIPRFHIGGLAIEARAYLSGAKLVSCLDKKWNPHEFHNILCEQKITLTSLVPTQVYDLIFANLKAPSYLRAVIVGGGALSEVLYNKGRQLGWPLLPSFGMTECCSQIATAPLSSLDKFEYPLLQKLAHVEIDTTKEKILKIKSESLLEGYMQWANDKPQWTDPKRESWFMTEDVVDILGDKLKPLGRINDVIKVSGELVSLPRLRNILDEVAQDLNLNALQYTIHYKSHERLGEQIVLVSEKLDSTKILEQYNQRVLPFERAKEVLQISQIPRSPLGKILYKLIAMN